MQKTINRFYLDTEFVEGFTKPWIGKPMHFIDLISIGLVDQTGRPYYAISRDFDLKRAWNAYQEEEIPTSSLIGSVKKKVYWVRENVLKPIFYELLKQEQNDPATPLGDRFFAAEFSRYNLNLLLERYGKTNKQIAGEILTFVYAQAIWQGDGLDGIDKEIDWWLTENQLEFYAYFADYDWVLFCSLFGRMVDLPAGFPYYCRDLKQLMDHYRLTKEWKAKYCPDPKDEHNALADANWNRDLHKAITSYLTVGLDNYKPVSFRMDGYAVLVDESRQSPRLLAQILATNPTIQEFIDRCEAVGELPQLNLIRLR